MSYSKKDMLGPVVRALVGVPKERLGVVLDIANKLGSNEGESWKIRLAVVLREGVKTDHATKHIIDCDADPFVPDGWKVEEHRKGGMFEWSPDGIGFYLSERQKNGSRIDGHDLRKELTDQPVLNANVLDYLLANKHLIPEEWKGNYVPFWGTVYRYSGGDLCVRFLYWDDGGWDWDGRWLVSGWGGVSPAVVRAS